MISSNIESLKISSHMESLGDI